MHVTLFGNEIENSGVIDNREGREARRWSKRGRRCRTRNVHVARVNNRSLKNLYTRGRVFFLLSFVLFSCFPVEGNHYDNVEAKWRVRCRSQGTGGAPGGEINKIAIRINERTGYDRSVLYKVDCPVKAVGLSRPSPPPPPPSPPPIIRLFFRRLPQNFIPKLGQIRAVSRSDKVEHLFKNQLKSKMARALNQVSNVSKGT